MVLLSRRSPVEPVERVDTLAIAFYLQPNDYADSLTKAAERVHTQRCQYSVARVAMLSLNCRQLLTRCRQHLTREVRWNFDTVLLKICDTFAQNTDFTNLSLRIGTK